MVIESERDDSPLDFGTAYRERVLGDICFRLDQLTIGGDDTPAPPASTLWSSEKGLGRLSTHVRPCEFGDSTAGWCGDRNISWEMQVRKQA